MAIDFARQLIARWPNPEPSHAALLRAAGIEAIFSPQPAPAGWTGPPVESETAPAAARGLWPGIRRPGQKIGWDNEVHATASTEPWIDSNLYLAPLERALTGRAVPVSGYEAGPKAGLPSDRSVPFDTLELALIEARLQGGNYILSIDPRYRAALLAGDAAARTAWSSLGRLAAWLEQCRSLCGLAAPPAITALVETGMPTAELANLLFRRNASPRLVSAATLPAPGREAIRVLVAASLREMPAGAWNHAEAAGATLVIDDPARVNPAWKRLKEEPDREFYALGRGQVVAYRKRIAEPSEFAMDMIDLAGHAQRTARAWNAQSAVVFATAGPAPGEALLHLVNYGSPIKEEVQARLQGRFTQATLLRPEAPPLTLKTAGRGLTTEVFLPNLARVAIVRFRA